MRILLVLSISLMFLLPVSAMAQMGDGPGDNDTMVPSMGPLSKITTSIERFDVTFDNPMTYSGMGVGGGTAVMVNGLMTLNRPGLPRVPYKSITKEFSANIRIENVKASHGPPTSYIIPGEPDIAPPAIAIGPNGPLGMMPVFDHYNGERFPSDWFTYDVHRGMNAKGEATIFVNIFIFPVSLEALNGPGYKVSFINSIGFHIEYGQEVERDTPRSRDIAAQESYDLLIIGPWAFEDAFKDLAEHKEATGMTTKVVTLGDIYNGAIFETQGRDDQEKIKYFIKDAYEAWGVSYVIMGGDVDQVPTRHAAIYDGYDDDGSWGSDGYWVPTDNYFADLYDGNGGFSTWDESNNDVFGEWSSNGYAIDDPDFYLDVYIGRLPASNSVEMGIMVNKIISYENNTDWTWFFKAGLAGVDTWVNDGSGVPESEYGLDQIGANLQGAGFALTKMYETQGTLSATAINNAINGGLGAMIISGHGLPTGWGSETSIYYSTNDIWSLNNGVKLPIGSQAACSTGAFDNEDTSYYPGWGHPESMSEEFLLRNGGGEIANVGSSRVAYGAYGTAWTNYNAGHLNRLFYKALVDGQGTPGKMFSKARNDYMDTHGTTYVGDFKHMASFNLFGDPSVALGGIGISVSTENTTTLIAPGQSADFSFTVKNVGLWAMTASLKVLVGDGPFSASLDKSSVTLQPDGVSNVIMTVSVDANGLTGSVGTFTLLARSSFNDRSASASVSATVKQIYGMGLTTDSSDRTALPGGEAVFNLSITNKGNGDDGATLSTSELPSGWGIYMPGTHVVLAPYETTDTTLTVSLPQLVKAGDYAFNVTAVLDGAAITRTLKMVVSVLAVHDIELSCVDCSLSVDPGVEIEATVTLSNLGNVLENISLVASGPAGWDIAVSGSVQTLAPFASTDVQVTVKAGERALALPYTVTVDATIPYDTTTTDIEINVNRIYGIELVADDHVVTVNGGDDAIFDADVMNRGNGPELVNMEGVDVPLGWVAQGNPQSFTVPAYSTYRLELIVSTDFDTLANEYEVRISAQGQDGPKLSDEATLKVAIAERVDGTAELDHKVDKAYPATAIINTVTFENHGNVEELVRLSSESAGTDLEVKFRGEPIIVLAGESSDLTFSVTVPPHGLAGDHAYNVIVERSKGPSIILNGTVDVSQVFGFDIKVDPAGTEVDKGERMRKRVEILNTGNGQDTFTFDIIGGTKQWASISEDSFTMEPGATKVVYVDIAPPSDAAPEAHDLTVEVTSSCGSSKDDQMEYKVSAPEEKNTAVVGVMDMVPMLIAILLIMAFVVARAMMGRRRKI